MFSFFYFSGQQNAQNQGGILQQLMQFLPIIMLVLMSFSSLGGNQQQQVRMQMAVNLLGVVSQTLVKRKDGRGRVAAFETMVAISAVRNLVREAKTHQISSIIQTGHRHGMQTLDQSLANLVRDGVVSYEDAREKAGNIFEFEAIMDGQR